MESQILKVGVIGCGQVAERRHFPTLLELSELEAAAAADVDPDRLRYIKGRFGVPALYEDYEKLLAQPDIEAVVIAVPTPYHVEIAIAALDAGKHVLLEKPLALTLEEADRLADRAAESDRVLMIGLNMRWHRLIMAARKRVQCDELGSLKAIHSVYTHTRDHEDPRAWTMQRAQGGGVIFNEAVHHFDLWRYVIDAEVEEIFARIESPANWQDETAVVNARLSDGIIASGTFSLMTGGDNALEIYGEAGRLYVSCYRFDGLEFYPKEAYAGDIGARVRRALGSALQVPKLLNTIRAGGDFVMSYRAEWAHFLECIREGKTPLCTVEDGRRSLAVVLSTLESASTGQPVRIEEAPRDVPLETGA